MDTFENKETIILNEEYIDMPFSGNINETFDKIQLILDENNLSKLSFNILENISGVIEMLANLAYVHEELVFDIAQVYILIKHSKISFDKIEPYFDDVVIKRAKVLLKEFKSKDDYLKYVFENKEWAYIRKIKLADYLFDLKSFKSYKDLLKTDLFYEVKMVIEKYENISQINLINEIKKIIIGGNYNEGGR